MTNKQLTFAFFGNTYQLRKSTSLACALDYLRSRNERIIFDRKFRDFLSRDQLLDLSGVEVFDGDKFEADYAVSIGGDGTFLKTAVRIGRKNIPAFLPTCCPTRWRRLSLRLSTATIPLSATPQ